MHRHKFISVCIKYEKNEERNLVKEKKMKKRKLFKS